MAKNHIFHASDGIEIFYDDLGQGFPIVFLHGNSLSKDYFANQRVLSQSFRLILVDSRAHGKSGHNGRQLSFEYMAKDVEEFLSFLAISSCLLVGHSDGANLALTYTKYYPARVGGILFNAGNCRFSDLKLMAQIGIKLEVWGLKLASLLFSNFKRAYQVAQLMDDDLDLTPLNIHKMTMPVWVLMGENDMVKADTLQELAEQLPRGRFINLPHVGHHPARQCPDDFNDLVLELLTAMERKLV